MATAEMSTIETPTDERFDRIQALEQQVLLVCPSMGLWQGRYQIPDARVMIGESVAERDTVTKPQIKILECSDRGKHYKKQFQTLDSSRHRIVESFSVKYPITGVRLIPRKAATKFFEELVGDVDSYGIPVYMAGRIEQSIHYRLNELADEFTREYPSIIAAAESHVAPEIWRKISHLIPSQDVIRGKFYMRMSAVRLSGGGAERVNEDDLRGMSSYLQQSIARQVEEAIEEMIAEPRRQMAQAIEDLNDLVTRGGRVSSKSFNPITSAIEKLRMFAFMNNDELAEKLNHLERRVNLTPASNLTDATLVSSGLASAMQEVQRAVTSADEQVELVRRFGRPLRAISLPDADE